MAKATQENLFMFQLKDFGVCPSYDRFSVHKGVLVVWDEDKDSRVLEFVDDVTTNRLPLAAVQEREGRLFLIWNGPVPAGYEEGQAVDMTSDLWDIDHSVSLEQ